MNKLIKNYWVFAETKEGNSLHHSIRVCAEPDGEFENIKRVVEYYNSFNKYVTVTDRDFNFIYGEDDIDYDYDETGNTVTVYNCDCNRILNLR